jgi:hypothetical protein
MTATNQVLDSAGYPTSWPAEGVARYDRAVDLPKSDEPAHEAWRERLSRLIACAQNCTR